MSKEQIQEFDEVWAEYLTEVAKKTKQPALPPITLAPEVLDQILTSTTKNKEWCILVGSSRQIYDFRNLIIVKDR